LTTYFKHAPLYGVWKSDSFTADGSHPAAVADAARWRQLTAEFPGSLYIHNEAGDRVRFEAKYDESKHTLTLSSRQFKQKGDFSYSLPDAQHLTLRGNLNGNPVFAEFHRFDASQFLLISRG